MRTSALLVVVSLTVLTAGCGGSRQLQSLAVTPAAADAKSFPNGQVQFTALGTFTDGSKAQVAALWTLRPVNCPVGQVCPDFIPGGVRLSNSGVAACTGTGTVMVSVLATAPVDINIPISKVTGTTKTVAATAQLTCP